jgi:cytochrome c peroxidase
LHIFICFAVREVAATPVLSVQAERTRIWSTKKSKVERFYTPRTINGQWIHADGPIKTFTLRGIKDSPPYLHDGRLLTLEDTVEFFNLVLGVQLTTQEKTALIAFLRTL